MPRVYAFAARKIGGRRFAPARRQGAFVRRVTKGSNIPYRARGYLRRGGYYGRFKSGPGSELKFKDTALSFQIDTTGEVPATGQLALIAQGVTESQRVGRACMIKSIQIKGEARLAPSTAAVAAVYASVWLVQDTQCNGAAANMTDVYTTNDPTTAMINMANSGRFKVLKEFKMMFNPPAGATTAYNEVVKPMKFYKKCNIPIEFSSTTGAITEIKSNNLFLLAASKGGDDLVSVYGVCRLRFSDY